MSPQDNVIPHQIAVPQRVSTMPPADLAVSPRVSAMPTQASVIPQSESVIPYQESVKPPRESVRVPHESVIIQHVYLPPRLDANLRFYRNEIRFRPDGELISSFDRQSKSKTMILISMYLDAFTDHFFVLSPVCK